MQTLSWNDFISAEKFGYMNNNVKTPYATYISGTNGKIVFEEDFKTIKSRTRDYSLYPVKI